MPESSLDLELGFHPAPSCSSQCFRALSWRRVSLECLLVLSSSTIDKPVPQPLRRHSQTTLSLVPQNEEKRSLSLGGHVGFDSLPDQLVSKSVTQGFCFNILCVGETGIGKSTLMNTLFNTTFENEEASHYQNGVYLRPRTYDLQESNVHLKLTIVDTVGFGDQINKDESYKPIVDYIDTQFENYLQEELKIKRSLFNYHDTRIHICLYFIAPTGHSLKSLDLVTMKKLDSKVNIIPIIAKADTISKSELHKFKIKIMSELVSNGVQIYQFPTDDEAVAEINSSMNAHLPFAVVGSVEEVKVGNKMVRARQYPWGVVQGIDSHVPRSSYSSSLCRLRPYPVENESHCDFVKLREMLIRINMEDLREQTHARHYELYRRCKLEEMGFKDTDPDSQPFSLQETYEAKRKEFLTDLQRKEEEMRQMFVNKVKETEAELKEKERELHEKFEQLKRMHQEEKRKVEEKRRDLEEEMNGFNRKKLAAETLSLSQPLKKDKDKKKCFGHGSWFCKIMVYVHEQIMYAGERDESFCRFNRYVIFAC
ncbi:hypothetical protein P4O66_002847 [Electrophorus voltai]|uniref:Septin-type G domain-containing protein n=1 Tax=Electrophorus voltai TaxID=2609070 RepID=A0AAD8YTZ8_9TELE|nr:hypothetical protein P4O66_002847 [Electrophorus voltai]